MLKFGCLLVILVLLAIPTIAMYFLPRWSLPIVLIAELFTLVYVVPKVFKFGLKRFALGLLGAKSRVLRGAGVHVHAVRAVNKPVRRRMIEADEDAPEPAEETTAADGTIVTTRPAADDSYDDNEETDEPDRHRYVLVDFTLTPAPGGGGGPMQFYDPSELLLVPFDAKVDLIDDPTGAGRSASAFDVKVVDPAGAESDGDDKLTGPAHLRVVFACPPELTGRAKFRYYLEAFGDLVLP